MNKPTYYYNQYRPEMLDFLPNKYRVVLEVGCGEGNFVSNLPSPCEKWGIEPSPQAAKIASKKLDHVLVGKYTEVADKLPDDFFDLVICNDVIEHMEDHMEFLNSIKKKIKKNGFIVISIPNVRYISNLFRLLVLKDWQYTDEGILDETHLRFFTEKSLKRIFKEQGFSIAKFAGINKVKSWKYVIYIFVNILLLGYFSDIKYLQFAISARKL